MLVLVVADEGFMWLGGAMVITILSDPCFGWVFLDLNVVIALLPGSES